MGENGELKACLIKYGDEIQGDTLYMRGPQVVLDGIDKWEMDGGILEMIYKQEWRIGEVMTAIAETEASKEQILTKVQDKNTAEEVTEEHIDMVNGGDHS